MSTDKYAAKLERRIRLILDEGSDFIEQSLPNFVEECKDSFLPALKKWAKDLSWPIALTCPECKSTVQSDKKDFDSEIIVLNNKMIFSQYNGYVKAITRCKKCGLESMYLLISWPID